MKKKEKKNTRTEWQIERKPSQKGNSAFYQRYTICLDWMVKLYNLIFFLLLPDGCYASCWAEYTLGDIHTFTLKLKPFIGNLQYTCDERNVH